MFSSVNVCKNVKFWLTRAILRNFLYIKKPVVLQWMQFSQRRDFIHVAFHPRDPCGVFHQGALRFRQHAGVSKHFELRRQQREHFPGRAGARLSGQRHFDMAKPKEPRSEGLWAADGADAGGQHPRRADAQQHRRAHRQNHLRRGHHPHRAGYAARAGQAAKREKNG